jgi:hypothetical protein
MPILLKRTALSTGSRSRPRESFKWCHLAESRAQSSLETSPRASSSAAELTSAEALLAGRTYLICHQQRWGFAGCERMLGVLMVGRPRDSGSEAEFLLATSK